MFTNIHGHTEVTTYLTSLVNTGNFPSALFFHGPSGVGKRTLALELAKRMNCRRERQAFCVCPSCKKIDQSNHMDVLVFQPDGNTFKIDQVRSIIEEADRYRMEGDWRVFILEDVHLFNAKSADALLKTLEEGRENTLFILISNSKEAVVSTLTSRCLEFYMGLLTDEDVRNVLSDLQVPASESTIRLSEGSVERALYFLQGAGFEVRRDMLDILGGWPSTQDHLIISKINQYEDRMDELLDALYVILTDVCLVHSGSVGNVRNRDVLDQISKIEQVFRRKCFDAVSLVQDVRSRVGSSVALDHHVKMLLLALKDVLRT